MDGKLNAMGGICVFWDLTSHKVSREKLVSGTSRKEKSAAMKVALCFICSVIFVVYTEKFSDSVPRGAVAAAAHIPHISNRKRVGEADEPDEEKPVFGEGDLWPPRYASKHDGSARVEISSKRPPSHHNPDEVAVVVPDIGWGSSNELQAVGEYHGRRPVAKGNDISELVATVLVIFITVLLIVVAYFRCGARPKRCQAPMPPPLLPRRSHRQQSHRAHHPEREPNHPPHAPKPPKAKEEEKPKK